ncbi:MAG: hypothetical protein IKY31_07695 [Bacteroidaceae bacterium]|nr:hypothetical protein [Bacteroidaceae bacterium]
MRYKLCLLLAMCAIHLQAQTWISLTNSKVSERGTNIEVLASDASQYKFKVTINGFYKEDIIIEDTTYNKLYIDKYETLDKVGYPELPVVNQLLGFPKGTYGKVTISDITWENLSGYTVYPSQRHFTEAETSFEFSKDIDAYSSASYFPAETYNFGESSYWGGLKMCNLRLHPFCYNSSTSQLRIMKEFTVKVDFIVHDKNESENSEIEVLVDKKLYSLLLSNYNDALINSYGETSYSRVINNNTRVAGRHYNLLIISAPQYKNDALLARYLKIKAKQGFACKVVSTGDIGNTPTQIKNYIRNQRTNYGIEYVLLIGNHTDIPPYSWTFGASTNPNGATLSDYWYGCMGNDNHYNQDIAIGRFCVSNVSELHNVINKHYSYIAPNNLTNDWFRKVVMVAHKGDYNDYYPTKYKDCLNNIINKYNTYYDFITQYGSDSNVGNNSVVNIINQGVGLVVYRGHGTPTGWKKDWSYDDIEFGNTQINRLSCPIINPIVFSFACKNSRISESPCLMEDFITKESAAVLFLGATEDTHSGENDLLSELFFEHICIDSTYRIGDINKSSQTILVNRACSNQDLYKANAMAYMIGGDPTLELWTDNPKRFSPEDIEVIQNKDSVIVSVSNNGLCDISLCSIEDLGLSYFQKAKKVSTYTFTGVDVPCYISVNKHNYIPYTFNEDVTIRSKVIDNGSALVGNNITVGATTITDSGTLTIKANNNVTLNTNFNCELGGTLIIK